jgi:hypothetical protein
MRFWGGMVSLFLVGCAASPPQVVSPIAPEVEPPSEAPPSEVPFLAADVDPPPVGRPRLAQTVVLEDDQVFPVVHEQLIGFDPAYGEPDGYGGTVYYGGRPRGWVRPYYARPIMRPALAVATVQSSSGATHLPNNRPGGGLARRGGGGGRGGGHR